MSNTHTKKHIDIYALITNRIIEHLENGVIPWRQPWTNAGAPQNLVTGKHYRGINTILLASLHYSQNSFLTYKQAKELGGSVKKGEKSHPVIFWKRIDKENKATKEIEQVLLLRYYNVFNIAQCEGIPQEKLPPVIQQENDPIQSCEHIIATMPNRPEIRHNEHRAYYHLEDDYVNMPAMNTFTNSQSYYGTLFHELIHSSGHPSRLNRKELIHKSGFGTEQYAIEELTAEIGSSYLKSSAGIPIENLENTAAYIQSWLTKLRNDKKLIVYASTQAQKAADFILDVTIQERELVEEYSFDKNNSEQRIDKLKRMRTIGNQERMGIVR